MPDFNRLKVGKHHTDPRAATSVVIAVLAVTLAVMLSLLLREPARYFPPMKTGEQVAPPPPAGKVTIVATTPRMEVPNLDVPCAEQTWPYIDRRCLTESTQKRPQPETRPAETAAAPPVDARSAATSPVAPAVNPPAPTETQTAAPREDIAPQPREWVADSNAIMQDEPDEEWVPMMPPPEQYRRDRRRYDPGRQIERQFRAFTRHIFPRF